MIMAKFNFPYILLILLISVIFGNLFQIRIPQNILIISASFILVLIIMVDISKLNHKEFDDFYYTAMRVSLTNLIVNIIVFSYVLRLFVPVPFNVALLFSILISITSQKLLPHIKSEILKLLHYEAMFNAPFAFFFVSLCLTLMGPVYFLTFDLIKDLDLLLAPLTQICIGFGVGLILGLILLKLLYQQLHKHSAALLLIFAFFAYFCAENIGGSGMIAAIVFAWMYGNMFKHRHIILNPHSSIFLFLEILMFGTIGLLSVGDYRLLFLTESILLFIVYLLLRFISISLALVGKGYNPKEKLFMTVSAPKNLSYLVLFAFLLVKNILVSAPLFSLGILFVFYSLILNSIATMYAKRMISIEFVKPITSVKKKFL
jgi:NhaP-type Na+/H+ or K+/H+ antiporter